MRKLILLLSTALMAVSLCAQSTGGRGVPGAASGGGGATLPFPGIVYATSATGGTVATASQVNTLLQTLTGCTTAGTYYSVQTGTCTTPSAGNASQVNGAAVPASANVLGSNSLSQLISMAVTGTGNNVLATSPTLVTPALGTIASGNLAAGTGYVAGNLTGVGNCAQEPAATGDATSTAGSCALTVGGIKGITVPTPTAGYLQYTGSAYAWTTPSGGGTVNTGTANAPAYYPAGTAAVSPVSDEYVSSTQHGFGAATAPIHAFDFTGAFGILDSGPATNPTVTTAMLATDTTMAVSSTTGMPPQGHILLGPNNFTNIEVIQYTSIVDGTHLGGLVRGQWGSTGATQAVGTIIYTIPFATTESWTGVPWLFHVWKGPTYHFGGQPWSALSGVLGQGALGTNGDVYFTLNATSGITTAGTMTAGTVAATKYTSATNCSSAASPAVCAAAASGSFVVAAAATTVTVNTTAVTAASQILITPDSSLGTKLTVTCNTTIPTYMVTARTAATSFTLTLGAAPATNPECFSYSIVN